MWLMCPYLIMWRLFRVCYSTIIKSKLSKLDKYIKAKSAKKVFYNRKCWPYHRKSFAYEVNITFKFNFVTYMPRFSEQSKNNWITNWHNHNINIMQMRIKQCHYTRVHSKVTITHIAGPILKHCQWWSWWISLFKPHIVVELTNYSSNNDR